MIAMYGWRLFWWMAGANVLTGSVCAALAYQAGKRRPSRGYVVGKRMRFKR